MTTQRSLKRQVVWEEMSRLEDMGLGHREMVSVLRDKFVLDASHSAVTMLTTRPGANGFVRADEDTLLFRAPSENLRHSLTSVKQDLVVNSEKGYELRWSTVDISEIRQMFEAIRSNLS
jgi:hypothetical protein